MVEFAEVSDNNDDVVPPSEDRLLDAQEIESVLANVKRPTARMHLEALAKKLRKESDALKRVEASQAKTAAADESSEAGVAKESDNTPVPSSPTPSPPKRTPATSPPIVSSSVPYVPIDKFAFDAGGYNSGFVTLYIDLPGVGSIDKSNISCSFTATSFDLIVHDLKGKSYRLFKDNLENDIDAEKSKRVVKADKVLVKLAKKKSEYGSYDHWSSLTSKKSSAKKASGSKKDDPTAGIMDLMKQMYEDGDDNMRKVIGETMMKQREGKLGDGMGGMGGGMGGLGDMDMDV